MSAVIEHRPNPPFDIERDIDQIRADFPILSMRVGDKPLVYLDNAASSQMPQRVIDRIVRYQTHEHSNIHRAVHYLSETATAQYEAARGKVRAFINAGSEREIVLTSGTTDAINLVMHGYGRKFVDAGDEIVISAIEHHANIVPWQMLCEERGAKLKVIPVTDAGELAFDAYQALLNPRVKLVCITHVSNALGTIVPIKDYIDAAHLHGIPVLVDGAQAAPHLPVDVQALGCDFYAFSGHKVCGPTGIGVLFGRAEWLEKMQPFKGGGDMISSVSFEKTTYNVIPYKFEAGTPPIMAAIALGEALDYLSEIGLSTIARREHELLAYATDEVSHIGGLRIIGTAERKAAVLSMVVEGIHPHDLGTLLNEDGVAIRTGHHCAQPVMTRFKVPATARASFAFYNTFAEVDALVASLKRAKSVFGVG
ncbi:MAG: cysteine desulfurase [Proteobacteria bacterium]|nr:cysteine desulfurase [Burkholderiales bacterium]